MVLFLFVIMLVNLDEAARQSQFNKQWAVALACAVAVGAEMLFILAKGRSAFPLPAPVANPDQVGNTEAIALSLFSNYLLPFEVISLLILIAILGAVVLARKEID